MNKLKTLKDLKHYLNYDMEQIEIKELKAEAVKWVKYIKENGGKVTDENFMMKFFNLSKEDFDFVDGTIRINMGKNSKDRIVPIPKGFTKYELKWIPIGVKPRALQKEFIKACEESGVQAKKPKVHFHSLRHGFATECIRSDRRLSTIQGLMGHEDLSTTAIYINLMPKERIKEYQERFLSRE